MAHGGSLEKQQQQVDPTDMIRMGTPATSDKGSCSSHLKDGNAGCKGKVMEKAN